MKKLSYEILRRNKINVGLISLNSPESRNSLTLELLGDLKSLLLEIENSSTSNVSIISSTHSKVFSSGFNLKELYQADSNKLRTIFNLYGDILLKMKRMNHIFLSEANGVVTAAGCTFALTCDIVVAEKESKFSIPGRAIGLYPDIVAIDLIQNFQYHLKDCYEFMTCGKILNSEEALSKGLITCISKDYNSMREDSLGIIDRISIEILSEKEKVGKVKKFVYGV